MLTLLSKIPSYAKFLNEICTNKRKFTEKVKSTAAVSSLLPIQMPKKLQDKGTFTIPCRIGEKKIPRAFCDPGAGINMLSLKEYQSMKMGPLKPTSVTIQVADRNILIPKGVIEDVLVKVDYFIYLVDFYVIDLNPYLPSCQTNVLLGRPFLITARAKIDCFESSIYLEFCGEIATFNMSDSRELSGDRPCVNAIYEPMTNEASQPASTGPSEVVLCSSLTAAALTALENFTSEEKGLTRQLHPGQRVLLINPQFKNFSRAILSEWTGPFTITEVFPNGAINLQDEITGSVFNAEGKRVKPFWDDADWVIDWVDFDDPPPLKD